MVYYLCQECLNDQALTRLRRGAGFWCPVDSQHDPQLHAPVMITRGRKGRAVLAHLKDSTTSQGKAVADMLSKVEAAIPEILEALDATDDLVSAKMRKWRALDRLPHKWRMGER